MKNVFIILITGLFTFGSCKKIDKLTQFNITYNETITIPSSIGINLPFNIQTPDINSNAESTFESNNTRKDLIEKIVLKSMELTLTAPSNSDFGFLKSIEIFISAEGLPEEKIAFKNNIPANIGKFLALEPTGADFKEYIKKNTYKLRVNTTTDEVISSDHKIDIKSVFFVDAKILGQ